MKPPLSEIDREIFENLGRLVYGSRWRNGNVEPFNNLNEGVVVGSTDKGLDDQEKG